MRTHCLQLRGGARAALFVLLALLQSTAASAGSNEILLWPGGAPGSENWQQRETATRDFLPHKVLRNVVQPTLTPYLADPADNSGIAVIVAPGGGFKFLSVEPEGSEVAQWLRDRGVNAFVLKYRLDETLANPTLFKLQVAWMFLLASIAGSDDYPGAPMSEVQGLAIEDALRAIEYLRANAGQLGVRADAIGALGFSAGGAVVTGAAMRGRGASRPDFAGSVYGVPDTAEIPQEAPPLFVLVTEDDPVVPARWGRTLHQQWRAAGHVSTLVSYPDGGHGFGMRARDASSDGWIEGFYQWLLATAGSTGSTAAP